MIKEISKEELEVQDKYLQLMMEQAELMTACSKAFISGDKEKALLIKAKIEEVLDQMRALI